MSLFRQEIDKLTAYMPGEQPPPGTKVIKLNTNENPYPPSPKAIDVLRGLDEQSLRLYPKPYADDVREAVSDVLNVPAEWVLVGNGSDDLLTMIMRSALWSGKRVAYPSPTYVLYRTLAEIQQADVLEVPFGEDYSVPSEQLVSAGAAVTIIATPNSPSGTAASNDLLAGLAGKCRGLVVIDEAYADFADDNAMDLVSRFQNVIVLRTLSKGYSLAGLRLGFGVARPDVIEGLSKVKDSYNVDAVACMVGAAAIRDQAHKDSNVHKVKASRKVLSERLQDLGFRVWPSQANFLLVRPPAGDAESIYQSLKQRGIFVRYFKQPRLDDKLRITVGTDEQNAVLLDALGELVK